MEREYFETSGNGMT